MINKLVALSAIAVTILMAAPAESHGGWATWKCTANGIRYSRKVFDFTEGLLRRKYRREDIALILGGNARRAMQQICERSVTALPRSVSPAQ